MLPLPPPPAFFPAQQLLPLIQPATPVQAKMQTGRSWTNYGGTEGQWFGEVIDAYRIRSVQVPPVWWKAFPLSHVADSLPPAALVEGGHSVKLPDMEVVPMIPMLNLCVLHPSILRWKILSKIIFHHPSCSFRPYRMVKACKSQNITGTSCSFRTSLLLFVSPRPGVSGPPPVMSWHVGCDLRHKGQKKWEESKNHERWLMIPQHLEFSRVFKQSVCEYVQRISEVHSVVSQTFTGNRKEMFHWCVKSKQQFQGMAVLHCSKAWLNDLPSASSQAPPPFLWLS